MKTTLPSDDDITEPLSESKKNQEPSRKEKRKKKKKKKRKEEKDSIPPNEMIPSAVKHETISERKLKQLIESKETPFYFCRKMAEGLAHRNLFVVVDELLTTTMELDCTTSVQDPDLVKKGCTFLEGIFLNLKKKMIEIIYPARLKMVNLIFISIYSAKSKELAYIKPLKFALKQIYDQVAYDEFYFRVKEEEPVSEKNLTNYCLYLFYIKFRIQIFKNYLIKHKHSKRIENDENITNDRIRSDEKLHSKIKNKILKFNENFKPEIKCEGVEVGLHDETISFGNKEKKREAAEKIELCYDEIMENMVKKTEITPLIILISAISIRVFCGKEREKENLGILLEINKNYAICNRTIIEELKIAYPRKVTSRTCSLHIASLLTDIHLMLLNMQYYIEFNDAEKFKNNIPYIFSLIGNLSKVLTLMEKTAIPAGYKDFSKDSAEVKIEVNKLKEELEKKFDSIQTRLIYKKYGMNDLEIKNEGIFSCPYSPDVFVREGEDSFEKEEDKSKIEKLEKIFLEQKKVEDISTEQLSFIVSLIRLKEFEKAISYTKKFLIETENKINSLDQNKMDDSFLIILYLDKKIQILSFYFQCCLQLSDFSQGINVINDLLFNIQKKAELKKRYKGVDALQEHELSIFFLLHKKSLEEKLKMGQKLESKTMEENSVEIKEKEKKVELSLYSQKIISNFEKQSLNPLEILEVITEDAFESKRTKIEEQLTFFISIINDNPLPEEHLNAQLSIIRCQMQLGETDLTLMNSLRKFYQIHNEFKEYFNNNKENSISDLRNSRNYHRRLMKAFSYHIQIIEKNGILSEKDRTEIIKICKEIIKLLDLICSIEEKLKIFPKKNEDIRVKFTHKKDAYESKIPRENYRRKNKILRKRILYPEKPSENSLELKDIQSEEKKESPKNPGALILFEEKKQTEASEEIKHNKQKINKNVKIALQNALNHINEIYNSGKKWKAESILSQESIESLETALIFMNWFNRLFPENIIVLTGGALRDILTNQKPDDFDFATNATEFEIEKKMSVKNIGIKKCKIHYAISPTGKIPMITLVKGNTGQETNQSFSIRCNFTEVKLDAQLWIDAYIHAITLDNSGKFSAPDGERTIKNLLSNNLEISVIPKQLVTFSLSLLKRAYPYLSLYENPDLINCILNLSQDPARIFRLLKLFPKFHSDSLAEIFNNAETLCHIIYAHHSPYYYTGMGHENPHVARNFAYQRQKNAIIGLRNAMIKLQRALFKKYYVCEPCDDFYSEQKKLFIYDKLYEYLEFFLSLTYKIDLLPLILVGNAGEQIPKQKKPLKEQWFCNFLIDELTKLQLRALYEKNLGPLAWQINTLCVFFAADAIVRFDPAALSDPVTFKNAIKLFIRDQGWIRSLLFWDGESDLLNNEKLFQGAKRAVLEGSALPYSINPSGFFLTAQPSAPTREISSALVLQ